MKKQKNTFNREPGVSMPKYGEPKTRFDSDKKELPIIATKSFLKIFDCYIGRPEYSVIYDSDDKTAKITNESRGFVSTIKH